jgi:hypothetical protein
MINAPADVTASLARILVERSTAAAGEAERAQPESGNA